MVTYPVRLAHFKYWLRPSNVQSFTRKPGIPGTLPLHGGPNGEKCSGGTKARSSLYLWVGGSTLLIPTDCVSVIAYGPGFKIYIPAAPDGFRVRLWPRLRTAVDANNAIPLITVIIEPGVPRFVYRAAEPPRRPPPIHKPRNTEETGSIPDHPVRLVPLLGVVFRWRG